MNQIDYVKLAKSNQKFFYWKNKIQDLVSAKSQKDFRKQYNLGYNRNFYFYVKFFKQHTKVASDILGKSFLKDLSKMFFAETVENDLIIQYIPAIYSEMSKHIIPPTLWDDLYDCLLLGLRDSVWRFNREDIKFSTYAINGIRNNIKFFMCNSSRIKRMRKLFGLNFSELTTHQDEAGNSFYEKTVVDERITVNRFENAETIRNIATNANVTPTQMVALDFYMENGYSNSVSYATARKKMAKYVKNNTDILQDSLN